MEATKTEIFTNKDLKATLECTTHKEYGKIDAKDYFLVIKHNNKEYSVGKRYYSPEEDTDIILKDLLHINN